MFLALQPCHAPVTVFIPIQSTLFAGKDLAARTLGPADAVWYFPQLFLVPPLNAAILEVLDVPLSMVSDSLNANGPL